MNRKESIQEPNNQLYLKAFNHEGEYFLHEVCQFIDFDAHEEVLDNISCTVLIPVYNGLKHLRKLFPSVANNTPKEVKVLIVDDCSPDKEVQEYLRKTVEQYPNWKLMKNECNLGFVATVNHGMSHIDTDYAIWLNTDTEVPSKWVERLLYPFYKTQNVATTTPFTNSGVIFSFPNYMEDNKSPENTEETDKAFRCIVADEFGLNETYSGTGFCMGVNMACWNRIGPLNYEDFGKGYGEENDWCFRALQFGWRHLLVPNLFVSHHHGGSFLSEEKKKLCDSHQEILLKYYPDFMTNNVPRFQAADPWGIYRKCAALIMSRNNCLVFIDLKASRDNSSSGAVSYSDHILKNMAAEGYSIIIAQYEQSSRKWELLMYTADNKSVIQLEDFSDLEILFSYVNVKKIIINNLAYCEDAEKAIHTIVKIKKKYKDQFTLSYKFHDYFSLCPSFFLLDDSKEPCDPSNYEFCRNCIKNNSGKAVNRIAILTWRRQFKQLFAIVDQFDCFSYYSKDKILSVYPEIADRLQVIYHEPLLSCNSSKYICPREITELRIAFVGNFCIEKGSHFFQQLVKIFRGNGINAKFYLIGFNSSGPALNNITDLGKYTRDNLGSKLTNNKINLVVYPSINNETFSYVAQELMLLNMPIAVFPCGAPQERIRNSQYRFGRVAEAVNIEALCKATLELSVDVLSHHADCLTKKMQETLHELKNTELDLTINKPFPFNEIIDRSPVSYFVKMDEVPPYGVKDALRIWVNKHTKLFFKGTATRIPEENRCFGVRETLKIWIIKKMMR